MSHMDAKLSKMAIYGFINPYKKFLKGLLDQWIFSLLKQIPF